MSKMSPYNFSTLLFITITFLGITSFAQEDLNVVKEAHNLVIQAANWAQLSAHDESSLFFGHHHHHHHHGDHDDPDETKYSKTFNVSSQGGVIGSHDESSLIFGHHRRHHGGRGGGGGSGSGSGGGGSHDESLIFGRHRRHHGGRGGGGGHDDSKYNNTFIVSGDDNLPSNNTLSTLGSGRGSYHGGHHGGHDESAYNSTLLFGRGGRRGSGGGGHHGGHHGGHDDSTYNNTLIFGRGGRSGGGGGHHGGHHGGHDDSTYNNTLIFGRGGRSGGHHGGHHGGHDDSIYNSTFLGNGVSGANPNLTYNNTSNDVISNNFRMMALSDCAKLYEQAEPRLARLVGSNNEQYTHEDALAWLSGALTSHRTCLDGFRERGLDENIHPFAQNLTSVLNDALTLLANKPKVGGRAKGGAQQRPRAEQYGGLLSAWNPATSRANIVVARDGSGNYRTIKEAVDAIGRMTGRGVRRVVVHVKAGVYDENVEIGRNLKNVMFVGDGIDKTVITGRRNYIDGDSTVSSATFRVLGDGFWARDMTFENTAGPQKYQAVAMMAASDFALFYRCSFKGYQDTLYAHSLRQFYRDCKIHGTVDFIFGNAAVVFQNCDILVRRPMKHQANMITAQGRSNPFENTGISIHGSRIRPAPDLAPMKGSFKTFLGRPWKKYSRTVVAKTDLDGLIHPRGWTEWEGKFALSTLYYAEYMNTGEGSSTKGRVNWPGYHVLRSPREVVPFTVRNFLQGESWIMSTGVPVWREI